MFLVILTLITALSISGVAIYYSVAGLMVIFAGAAIPIMIMGSILEVSKLVTAVWLHKYWHRSAWWLKTYLLIAVAVLMLITSMGIFGFLSKAHIEQASNASTSQQEIIRIDDEMNRIDIKIDRANSEITSAENNTTIQSQNLQEQIDLEQSRIDSALSRVQPEIDRQLSVIEREQESSGGLLEEQLTAIETNLQQLDAALSSNQSRVVQGIVGVPQDGVIGPATRTAIDTYRRNQNEQRLELIANITEKRSEVNPRVEAAESEIKRLRTLVETEIANSNELINRLRNQLGQDNADEIKEFVLSQEQIIDSNNDKLDELRTEKYQLETELRLLEAEVGPVRYIAELIYGETNQDLLEQSVRWVILIIIFVFDPLAVLLLIASQYAYGFHRQDRDIKKK